MKTLHNFIVESAFNKTASSVEELYKNLHKPIISKEEFEILAKDIDKFIYSKVESKVKIPYIYGWELLNNAKSLDGVEIVGDVKRVKIGDPKNPKIKIKKGRRIIAELGDGSIGKVQTSEQEGTTVELYNTYVDKLKGVKESLTKDEEEQLSHIEDDLMAEFDKSWQKSFREQIRVLVEYINNFKQPVTNYKLCLYGSGPIGEAYKDMVEGYVRKMKDNGLISSKTNRNNIDPTDIILYNTENDIVGKLKNITNAQEFKSELWDTELCRGISLKKIKSKGVVDEVNVNNDSHYILSIGDMKVIGSSIENLDDDENRYAFQVEVETKDGEVTLEGDLRYFGGDKPYMDFGVKGQTHRIGKVGVGVWRTALGVNISTPLSQMKKQLHEIVLNQDRETMLKLVKNAYKDYDGCMPHLIIH